MTLRILILRNADDRDFDRYIGVPKELGSIEVARTKADAVVAAKKEEGAWDEIEDALVAAGFVPVDSWLHCEEEI